jgi:uncharacterized coiled-coil protein SlyX
MRDMKPTRPDRGDASEPDEVGADARVVQRAIANLRDRVGVQDDEIDTLRAMIRVLQNHSAADQLPPLQARLDTLETEVHQSLLDQRGEQGASAERMRNEVLPRLQMLEADIAEHRRSIEQIRDVVVRTDTNLDRLLTEVDRLVTEVARRPEPAPHVSDPSNPVTAPPVAEIPVPLFDADSDETRFRWRVPVVVLTVLVLLFLAAWGIDKLVRGSGRAGAVTDATASLSPFEQGRVYESQRNYAKAEALYKEVLKKDPNNNEVIRHLASVLFRQDKIEESAAQLKKLSGPDSTSP